jgi:hypothetical protein
MNLDTNKRAELVGYAKSLGITGYSKMNIPTLRRIISLRLAPQRVSLEHINADAERQIRNKLKRYWRAVRRGHQSLVNKIAKRLENHSKRWGAWLLVKEQLVRPVKEAA